MNPDTNDPRDDSEDRTDTGLSRRNLLFSGSSLATLSVLGTVPSINKAQAQQGQPAPGRKPNILMIMADDIGWFNVSAYNHGIMGYRTPNIDRIAREGAMFTDWYGEQSCTAGRNSLRSPRWFLPNCAVT